ncbi:hypothetical protein HHK36_002068 [Tetracentron sinense]|uniref:Phytocyanin domain-containing protein n=1 Tax=Tetracentron sinense TaxID=13715 RepID=A0A834ZUS7_TETSI|nr:hypothetical protein HHK36_002068 [Tetracentron sinense]
MNFRSFMKWVFLPLTISIIFNHSHATQTQPISELFNSDQFIYEISEWTKHKIESHLNLGVERIIAGILCFVGASISSAGGLGGGGLFLPILIIVAGLDLKTASNFSAFMVTGGSFANLIYNLSIKNPKFGGKTLIDYDIALLSEPCMLLGISVGVICNVVFPEWLITILFAVFLAWSTSKTCKAGFLHWETESEEMRRTGFGNLENELLRNETCDGSEGEKSMKDPLLDGKMKDSSGIPWKKLGVLFMVWFSFFLVYVLRGDKDGQGVVKIEPCGFGYWIISLFQVPLAVCFTAWILHQRESPEDQTFYQQEIGSQNRTRPTSSKLILPTMALLAGVLGGVFGVGGGMLISPLLLQVGIPPEVTAATCSFMVLFSSSMSAIQYLFLGMEHIDDALIFTIGCFFASLLGLMVIQRAILKHGTIRVGNTWDSDCFVENNFVNQSLGMDFVQDLAAFYKNLTYEDVKLPEHSKHQEQEDNTTTIKVLELSLFYAKVAMLRKLVSLASAALLIQLATGANFTVGGTNGGWDTTTNLQAWATSQSFSIGDNLIFQYTPNHDVLEVTKADYDSCQTGNPVQTHMGSTATIPLSTPGMRYFICGTPGHCTQGMKLQVDTVAPAPPPASPSSPTPATSISPSTPAPTLPPSNPPSLAPSKSPSSSLSPSGSTLHPSPSSAPDKGHLQAKITMGFCFGIILLLTL